MTVVGGGMLARALQAQLATGIQPSSSTLYFASGVSNSRETDASQYQREADLLNSHLSGTRQLVYFSTCSIADPCEASSPYVRHKLLIERRLRERPNSIVVRLPQVVGANANSNTLVQNLYQCAKQDLPIEAWTCAARSLIDVEDACRLTIRICAKLIGQNEVINIAGPTMTTPVEILDKMAVILQKPITYRAVEKGSWYTIDTTRIRSLIDDYDAIFSGDYLDRVLRKYCF